jgi:hypothetical protein
MIKCDVVYEDLEHLFHFKNMHIDVHIDQFSEIYPTRLLRHCATNQKVAGLRPDEVNEFFSIYLILLATLDPEVCSSSNRNEYQKRRNNVPGE